jgi:hypothetical protein
MDSFIITVSKDGKLQDVEVHFVPSAYSYRFIIRLDNNEIYFEPDEERNLRAIVPSGIELHRTQVELLQLIGEQIQTTLS